MTEEVAFLCFMAGRVTIFWELLFTATPARY